MSEPIPWDDVSTRAPLEFERPGMVVDLRRCIGCHACSVACKTEHGVPLGEFRLRVRWLPRPDRPTFSFLPLFDGKTCDFGANRGAHGMPPACVEACPTRALVFGDLADAGSPAARLAKTEQAKPFRAPEAELKAGVLYVGHEPWQEGTVHKGAALDPRDPDITYEQR